MFGIDKHMFFFFGSRGQQAPKPEGRTKEWCVLGLLYAAARSDAADDIDITPEEEITIDSLASRTRTLFGVSQATMDAHLAEHRAMLKGRNSVSVLVEAACESLPREDGLAEAIFAQCADIVMADRKVVGFENEFLRELGDQLRLSSSKRRDILKVMHWKNELKVEM